MSRASFRFYGELGDLLPPALRGVTFLHEFRGRPSVRDVIESLGVPHTEVDLVLADGESVDFSWTLRDGARVSVYPVFEAVDVAPLVRVRPAPLRVVRFVLDGRLGRLARDLRLLGFDALWRRDATDEELAQVSIAERRILLTRDRGLLERRVVTHGYLVRAADARRQLAEVVRRIDLYRSLHPFTRCLRCNGVLEDVAKADVVDRLPPAVRTSQDAVRRCPSCGRVSRAGSHRRRLTRLVSELLAGGWSAVVVKVDCYAGYRGEETPRRLEIDGRGVEVVEVVDRWRGPDHRFFKVRGDDGAVYLLRQDEPGDRWEIQAPGPA